MTKLQAVAKGALERSQLLLGVGGRKENARPLVARLGVVVQGHPMLLRVHASWMGKVTHIKVFDVSKGVAFKVKLRTPFAPVRETGSPRRLQLTMQVCKYKYPVSSGSRRRGPHGATAEGVGESGGSVDPLAVELVLKFTDLDSGRYSYRRMRLSLVAPAARPVTPPEGAGPEGATSVASVPRIRVNDLSLAEHKSLLSLSEHPSLYRSLLPPSATVEAAAVAATESKATGPVGAHSESQSPVRSVSAEGTLTSAGSPLLGAQSIAQGAGQLGAGSSAWGQGEGEGQGLGQGRTQDEEEEELVFSSIEGGYGGLDQHLDAEADLGVVSVTNAHTVEVLKEGFLWRGLYYLVRVVNEQDVTQVTFTQVCSDRLFVYLMPREHIDRSHSLARRWALLMAVAERNPAARVLLLPGQDPAAPVPLVDDTFRLMEGPSELHEGPPRVAHAQRQNPLGLNAAQRQAALQALQGPLTIGGLQVHSSMLPRGNGICLILLDPRNQPIIGSGLEVLDAVDYAPSSTSLLHGSIGERFVNDRTQRFSPGPGAHLDEVSAALSEGREPQVLKLQRGDTDLEFGSAVHVLGDDEEGLGFDSFTREESGLGTNMGEGGSAGGSAYELLAGAAAVRRPDGTVLALSPEEYEQMVLHQQDRFGLRLVDDSDMVGLRYGGALDDDSVSQVVLSYASQPSQPSSPVPADRHLARSPFQLAPPLSDPALPVEPEQLVEGGITSAQSTARLTADEEGETAATDSCRSDSGEVVSPAARVDAATVGTLHDALDAIEQMEDQDGVPDLPVVAHKEKGPPPAADNRLVAARKSISLGQNLGAALTAALSAEGVIRKTAAPTPPTSTEQQQQPRRASLRRRSLLRSALIKLKAVAVGTVSTAVGTALLSATTALLGDQPGVTDVRDLVPAIEAALATAEESLKEATGEDGEEAAEVGSEEEDWIAKLFRSAGFSDGTDGAEGSLLQLLPEAGAEGLGAGPGRTDGIAYMDDNAEEAGELGGAASPAKVRSRTMTTATSDWSEAGEEVVDTGVAAEAALADDADVEWIVELGSSGAVERVEEPLLEEVVDQCVLRLAEMVSDAIPGVRTPFLRSTFAEAADGAAQVIVQSDQLAASQLAEELEFQSMCVALVQIGEAVAIRRAVRSILAAERAREAARRRQISEERARLAAAEAAALAEAEAAAQAALAATASALHQTSPSAGGRKGYRAVEVNEADELLVAQGGKGGYFVKKIRSTVYSADADAGADGSPLSQKKGVSIAEHLRSQTARRHRLAAQRDTFTPDLPPSLQDSAARPRPHTDHAQHTAMTGPVSLSAPPPESRTHTPVPQLVPSVFEDGDTMFAQSMVPIHVTDNSHDAGRYGVDWEASEASLNNYFKLNESSAVTQSIPVAARAARSAGAISSHTRQVHHSRRAQSRGKLSEAEPPLWLTLGGTRSASFLLPAGADGSATYSALPDSASVPFSAKESVISAESMPFISMLQARAQSPAHPASALPNFAFDTAEGLKQALQDNWDSRTMPRYWSTALKARVDERINEPFAVQSAQARKQRRAIKTKSAFAAAAATAAVNSTSETRYHLDQQFSMLLTADDEVQDSFFESHIGPYAGADVPFQDTQRREELVEQRQREHRELREALHAQKNRLTRRSLTTMGLWAHPVGSASGSTHGTNTASYSASATATGTGTDSPQGRGRASTAPSRPGLLRTDTNNSHNTFDSWDGSATRERHTETGPSTRPTTTGSPNRYAAPFKLSFANTAGSVEFSQAELAVAAPLVHKVRKGLQHDHDFDESHLLSTQVEPPFHHIGTRVSCRAPADLSLHFKRSTAFIAEAVDEAIEREEVDEMFRKSLDVFHKVGYVTKRPLPHATHWVNVVSRYLASLKSIDELRKRLATLHRSAPRALTVEESVCVLSDVKGVVGQAIEKLKHLEYYAEIRLVCRSIHVRNMVLLLEGGDQVYSYKVGDKRAPRPVSFVDEEEEEFQQSGLRASLLAADGETLRQAAMVVDPYSPEMVQQHREVQAHRKIRKQWEETKGVSAAGQSVTFAVSDVTSEGSPDRHSPQSGLRCSVVSFRGPTEIETADDLSSTAEAVHEVSGKGLFSPAAQPKLRQNSKYVLSRASLVTLQPNPSGSFMDPQQASQSGLESHGGDQADAVPVMARAGLRASLSMTVSSPKRASTLMNNIGPPLNRHGSTANVRASTAGKGGSLLGAIAAAVEAADRADGTVPVQAATMDEREGGASSWNNLRGSLAPLDTGAGGSGLNKKSSMRLSKREWRRNSGIFDQPAPNSAAAAMQQAAARIHSTTAQSARTSSPKRTARAVTPKTATDVVPAPQGSPKWKVRSDGGRLVLEEDFAPDPPQRLSAEGEKGGGLEAGVEWDEDAIAEEGEGEDEEDDEGEEEDGTAELSRDEGDEPQVKPPLRPQVSINPWYLKNQQAQVQKQLSLTSSLVRSPSHLDKARPATAGGPMPSLQREASYRVATVVDEIFQREAVGVPFAVMSRRDAERAVKDEAVATKTNKQYIRQSVELRMRRLQHG